MLQTQIFIFVFYVLGKVLSIKDTTVNRNPCSLGAYNLLEEDRLSDPGLPSFFPQNIETQRPGLTLPSNVSAGQCPSLHQLSLPTRSQPPSPLALKFHDLALFCDLSPWCPLYISSSKLVTDKPEQALQTFAFALPFHLECSPSSFFLRKFSVL